MRWPTCQAVNTSAGLASPKHGPNQRERLTRLKLKRVFKVGQKHQSNWHRLARQLAKIASALCFAWLAIGDPPGTLGADGLLETNALGISTVEIIVSRTQVRNHHILHPSEGSNSDRKSEEKLQIV